MVLGRLRALLYLFAFVKDGFKIFDARRLEMLVAQECASVRTQW
jgi:hypothetical protein